jgi:hypothetical protein
MQDALERRVKPTLHDQTNKLSYGEACGNQDRLCDVEKTSGGSMEGAWQFIRRGNDEDRRSSYVQERRNIRWGVMFNIDLDLTIFMLR